MQIVRAEAGQPSCPALCYKGSQVLLERLVKALCLSVRLWVKRRGETSLQTELTCDSLPESRGEELVSVRDKGIEHAVFGEQSLHHELS